jgi:DNA-binding transcriptional ArsR family regulator
MSDPRKHRTKAELVIHPIRLRIIETLHGERLTPQQIGAEMPEVPPATLYRHIRALLQAGILQVVEERPVHGALEKVYALHEEAAYLSAEELSQITQAECQRYFAVFTASLTNHMARYLQQETINLYTEGVSFFENQLYMSDVEAVEYRRDLKSLLEKYGRNEPSPERRRRIVAFVNIPENPAGSVRKSSEIRPRRNR